MTTQVTFSDRPGLCWVSAFPMPAGGTHYGGDVFPLYDQRAAVAASLAEQITKGAHQPVVISNHNADQAVSHGVVRDWRILDRDQARTLGVQQKAELECYFGVEWTDPEYSAHYESGRLVYTSPELRGSLLGEKYAYQDETGHDWPFFVGELSVVGKPHNKRQTPSDTLRSVQMMEGGMEPDMMQVMIDTMRGLQASVDSLRESIKGAPAPAPMASPSTAAIVEEVVDEVTEDAPMAEDPEKAAMAERLRKMEHTMALRDATDRVRAAMSERTFTTPEAELVKLAMRDPAAFEVAKANAPKRPHASSRVAGMSDTAPAAIGSPKHVERVRAAMGEVKTPAQKYAAWRDVTRQVMGGAA